MHCCSTGATSSSRWIALIGENVWKKISSPRLARSRIKLSAYGQRQISVSGECTVDVTCGSTVLPVPLVVVSSGASLLGLNWIQAFQLDINAILYTPKASSELPSADVHTVGGPTDLDLKIYLVRVHSLSMSVSQDLALLSRCSISVSRSSKLAAFPDFSSMRPLVISSRLKGLLFGTIVLLCVPLFFN